MQAKDVMVSPVITVSPDASVAETANILLRNRISAVPVVSKAGALLGIVSEGDLIRRAEIGTERHRTWWLEMLASHNTIAMDYVKSHASKVSDIMTTWPVSVGAETPLAEIADLLEMRKIKRVPVVRDGKVIGIVSRADLLQAFAAMHRPAPEANPDDRAVRAAVIKTIDTAKLVRPYTLGITAKDGNVHLSGLVGTAEEKRALCLAAEVTPGVVSVTENLQVQPRMPAYL
ncbi:MAG: CBS domain-containing protein [Alphaproteobacteria bacterium]|nr:MAG: CBS domain-containing protein [Alphaproteobacteria bacterium]